MQPLSTTRKAPSIVTTRPASASFGLFAGSMARREVAMALSLRRG
jgi:hypothetical protein